MKRQILSLLLAVALVLSLGTAVFAQSEEAPETDVPVLTEGESDGVPAETPGEPPVSDAAAQEDGATSTDAAVAAPTPTPAPEEDSPTDTGTPAPAETPKPEDMSPTDTSTPAPAPARKDGWHSIGGAWYYYKGGAMLADQWIQDGASRYYVGADGKMASGLREIGGVTYYFNESHNGTFGAMLTGWRYVSGDWYFFGADGAMAVSCWQMDGKSRCYLNEAGRMMSGFLELDDGTYYLNEKHDGTFGAMVTGWRSVEGPWYYFSAQGPMVKAAWQMDGKNRCYLGEDGRMLAGFQEIEGKTYYLSEKHDGTYGAVVTGWRTIGGSWYHFGSDGVMTTGWLNDGANRFYMDEDGKMAVGTRVIDGVTYHFNEHHDGTYGAMATRQTYINGEMYMFGGNGALITDSDVTLLGKSYHVNGEGVIEGYVTAAGRQAVRVLDQVGWSLRAAFNWSAGIPYSYRALRASSGSVHTEFYADYGFRNRTGNCYVMASTFYQMAKMLGYEVYFVEGGVMNSRGTYNDHGWTELVLGGTTWVFDPNFTNETGYNGYQIQYGQRMTWRYGNYGRVA